MFAESSLPPFTFGVVLLGILLGTVGLAAAPSRSEDSLLLAESEIALAASQAHPATPASPSVETPPETPAATFEPQPDGTTAVHIEWDRLEGEETARHSATLVLAPAPAPEPTPAFLGACAGCVFLLIRRRAEPSKLRPARVSFSASVARQGSSARPRSARRHRARGPMTESLPCPLRQALSRGARTVQRSPRPPLRSRL